MNNTAKRIDGIRRKCTTPGARKIFDSLRRNSTVWVEWIGQALRGDAVDLPYAARQLEYVYEGVIEVEYQDLVFAMSPESDEGPLIPWDESVPEGAQTFVWSYGEASGDAEFFATMGSDGLPSASIKGSEQVGRVQGFGSEITYRVQELRAAAFAGDNLEMRLAMADKRAHATRLHKTAAWGREDLGLPGFFNNPYVVQSVAATKAAGGTAWENATAGEIIADVLGLVNGIRNDSRRRYRPTVIALPGRKLDILNQTRISEGDATDSGDRTIMMFLQKALSDSGFQIRFREVEDLLAENSLGYLDEDAMMAFSDDPMHVNLVVPIWYRLHTVQQVGFKITTPVESSIGGVRFLFPITAAMLTGI